MKWELLLETDKGQQFKMSQTTLLDQNISVKDKFKFWFASFYVMSYVNQENDLIASTIHFILFSLSEPIVISANVEHYALAICTYLTPMVNMSCKFLPWNQPRNMMPPMIQNE